MRTLLGDIRYALMTFRRAPAFAATVLLTLGLGIGSTSSVFSVVNGLLLQPLPYPESRQLVRLWEEHPGGTSPAGNRWLSQRTRDAWTAHSRTIENIGAYRAFEYTVRIGEEPSRMFGATISPSVFRLLRATPALGRFFLDQEEVAGAAPVAVLSNRLWRDRYASDPTVVGKSLVVDGRTYTIVGVARPGLDFPDPRVSFWIPYVLPTDAAEPGRTVVFSAIGRLRDDVTPAQAVAEGTAVARGVPRPPSSDFFFGKGGPVVVHARPFAADMTWLVRPALIALSAAVSLVLLIACANVANLMLTRGMARQRELALRAALGGSRARLIRQLLTESAVLAALGGAVGIGLASAFVRLLPLIAPERLPRLSDVTIDASVMTFALVASVFAAMVSGLAPALRSTGLELNESFRGSQGSTGAGSPGNRRLRAALLIVEAAFAVVLAVGASLLGHSFLRLTRVDAGYDTTHVLTFGVDLPDGEALPQRTAQLIDGVLERVRATPGVTVAGAGNMRPLLPMTAISAITLPAGVGRGKPTTGRVLFYVVTPGYAEALGLRLKAGRLFTEHDARGGLRAAVVNQEFVSRFVADGPVVGMRLGRLFQGDAGAESEIVGVVANVLKDGNDMVPQPEIYFPDRSAGANMLGCCDFVVRSSGDEAVLVSSLRRYVREVAPDAAIERIVPLQTLLSASWDRPRFAASVITGFAGLALALAGIGLYGALTYSVSQRRRELGLRSALGASRRSLVTLVIREGLSVTIVGVGVGLIAAMLTTRLIQTLLFGITPLDAVSFLLGPAVLVLVGLIACVLPAIRAARTDPAVVLRGE